ncbi:Cysteine synthase 2 [Marasmius crinis-equi]|uniref:Cysteine synthase 2 n=1 Tax=Marasmius crinis-equi TaxID=585013 RepID=A0ABR3FU91_9AGAR
MQLPAQWFSDKITPWFRVPSHSTLRHLFYGVILGFSLSVTASSALSYYRARREERELSQFEPRPIEIRRDEVLSGVAGLIGNTPLIRINSLSNALGIEIYGKAEFLNPGGSVKDRVALRMVEDAETEGLLRPNTGSRIFEGTVGSTGISIATIARARGYEATIIMPDDVAQEKVKALLALGAEVERVRPASIVDKKQYVNLARDRAMAFGKALPSSKPHLLPTPSSSVVVYTAADADENQESEDPNHTYSPRGFFADQFEFFTLCRIEATMMLIMKAPGLKSGDRRTAAWMPLNMKGTGGTIAGIGRFIKSKNEDVRVVLADPEGSGLYNKVKFGVMYDYKESEGKKRRHQVDTVVEGIGINRITNNISLALPIIDDAFRITDAEAVSAILARDTIQSFGELTFIKPRPFT